LFRSPPLTPPLSFKPSARAQTRFWEFFVRNIRNPHARRAYARAAQEFLARCEQHGVESIAEVQPLHVGTYVEMLTRSQSAPTAKQRLAGKIGNAPKLWQLPSSPAPPLPKRQVFHAIARPAIVS
jgi:hypothetical protein